MKVSFTKGQLSAVLKSCPKASGCRSALSYVRIEATQLVSVDGHRLSIVPIEGDPGSNEAPRYLPRSEAERIAKMLDNRERATLEWETGEPIALTIGGRHCGRIEDAECNWPDYARVIPNKAPEITIGFDAHYLKDLCDAVISTNTGRTATLAIDITDAMSATKFRSDGLTVVLMPCQL